MGIPGPAPKPDGQRARRNKPRTEMRFITVTPAEQPALADLYDYPDGDWSDATLAWWAEWGESPLIADMTAIEWRELAITAIYHEAFINGDLKAGTEYRQRMAKFGATPEDRAKLRIQTVTAAEATEKREARKPSPAASRFSGMKLAQ